MTVIQNQLNTQQAYQTLNVDSGSSFKDLKVAYRKLALELHPDKNNDTTDGKEFKKVTEAYHFLKKEYKKGNIRKMQTEYTETETKKKRDFTNRPKWGPPPGGTPQEDWGRFTKEFEDADPNWWKEYEKKFWQKYDKNINTSGKNGEFDKTEESKNQPNLFVEVDKSLCIGCCSCETIAPQVFSVDKSAKMNPKSSVINPKGAKFNKIMDAAQTCPTKAISVENIMTKEKLWPL